MKVRLYSAFGFLALSLALSFPAYAAKITGIDFKGTDDPSELTISGDGPLTFSKEDNSQDNQVIIEVKDASISKSNARKIDTSSFNSNVVLVSPYAVADQKAVRIVIQLREAGTVDVREDGNSLKVTVPRVGGSASAGSSSSATSSSPSSESAPSSAAMGSSTSSQADRLNEFSDNRQTRKFTGTPITLQVRDADVSDVFRLIGEASGFSIVEGDGVKGKISLSLVDVPWDQALDVVLHTLHLGAERNQNVLRVMTLADLTAEKMEEIKAAHVADVATPRAVKVLHVNHANLSELQGILSKFATPGLDDKTVAGVVIADPHTNNLVIRDVPLQIDRMVKLAGMLDVKSPQVLIEAKVIEATEAFSRTLSGNLGIANASSSPNLFASIAGGNPTDALIGSPGVFAAGTSFASSTNSVFGFSPNLSFLSGSPKINALLTWGESETQLKIVASPKTVVINKQKANIVQGTPVLVHGTSFVAGVGTVPTKTIQNANVSLSVTPTVTNDGSVLLDLDVAKDIATLVSGGDTSTDQGVGNRNMQTKVLVDSGSTLVIGGIYTVGTQRVSSGIPFLRKIPLIGAFFGSDVDTTTRYELFIFITPRILNVDDNGAV